MSTLAILLRADLKCESKTSRAPHIIIIIIIIIIIMIIIIVIIIITTVHILCVRVRVCVCVIEDPYSRKTVELSMELSDNSPSSLMERFMSVGLLTKLSSIMSRPSKVWYVIYFTIVYLFAIIIFTFTFLAVVAVFR